MFKILQCDSASAITLPLPDKPTSGEQVISDVVLVISLAVNFTARRLSSSLLTLSLQSDYRLMIIVKRQELLIGI